MKPRGNSYEQEAVAEQRHYRTPLAGGPSVLVYAADPIKTSHKRRFGGFDLPNFHKRKKSGELLPFTPFNQIFEDYSWTGRYSATDTVYRYHTDQNWFSTGPLNFAIDPGQIKALAAGENTGYAVQKAAASIYSAGFDAGTFIAELRKTVRSFATLQDRATRIIKSAAPRVRNLRNSWKLILDDSASIWLESRYAWRTLLYDIEDFSDTLSKFDEKRERYRQSSGFNRSYTESDSFSYNDANQWWTFTRSTVYDISVRGTVVADIKPPKYVTNPVTTGWELLRFSFIVDWFINVGNWLEALSFLSLQTGHVAAGGVFIKATRTTEITDRGINSGLVTLEADFSAESTVEYTQRTPQSVSLYPRSKLRLNVPKVVDLGALAYQIVRSRS
jgi:hypothetical protein